MSTRHLHIDALKVVASNLIVLHHFTVYGPLAEALDHWHTSLTDWFFDYARMAVQVFLVIGGYFAASALAPHGRFQYPTPVRHIARRYVRLVPPLLVALALVAACTLLARPWLTSDILPVYTGVPQVLAHAALAHSVLGEEPLSIGIWYVAIDFQLFALTALLLWAGGAYGKWVVVLVALASLFYFNLHESGDNWAPYFFGAYGMGAMAWWTLHHRPARWWALGLLALGLLALAWEFRMRIAIAWATAMLLCMYHPPRAKAVTAPATPRWPSRALAQTLARLSHVSYALFLTHFAVLILGNTAWVHLGWQFAHAPAVFTTLAWLVCLPTAYAFERWVERPLALKSLKQPAVGQ